MVSVLGGGISGLSAAYYLVKKNVTPITLYETSSRLGGWIKTEKHTGKGFIFESGPRTIRPKGPTGKNTLELVEDLGLEPFIRPIKSNHVAAKNRMIYVNKKLHLLPSSFSGVLKTTPPFTKPLFYAGLRDIFGGKSKEKLDDETMYDFAERRFGKEIADYAISAMLCGICAGDAKQISVKFLMKDIFENEQKYGGVIKGVLMNSFSNKKSKTETQKICKLPERAQLEKWNIYAMEGGLELLPITLHKKLVENNVKVKTMSECRQITFRKDKVYLNINGDDILTNHVISSLPSHRLSELVKKEHPILSEELKNIPFVDVALVNLQYDTRLLKYEGFGFLTPPCENLPILGVIFDSCCFNMKGNTVLTVMMGGKWFKERLGENPSKEELLEIAKKYVDEILEIKSSPQLSRVHVLKNCIPQYVVGHHRRVEKIKKYISDKELNLALCGASFDGVGVNDVIWAARNAVNSISKDA